MTLILQIFEDLCQNFLLLAHICRCANSLSESDICVLKVPKVILQNPVKILIKYLMILKDPYKDFWKDLC